MDDARRNAIVTGAASGLGRALAVRLAKDGWRVALADIHAAGCEETRKIVEAAGGVGQVEHLDVTSQQNWQSLAQRLRGTWPRLDLLVNNAGVGGFGDLGVFPLDDWHWLLSINLYGVIYGCHTLVEWLKQNPRGAHIINIASLAALAPPPSFSAYNVSKAGVVALSETLYAELKPDHVGVTVVCPGFFRTNIDAAARGYNARAGEVIRQGTESSRLTAESVADAAVRAMYAKQLYVVPGRQGKWYWWMRRLMPARFLDSAARGRTQPTGTVSSQAGTRRDA